MLGKIIVEDEHHDIEFEDPNEQNLVDLVSTKVIRSGIEFV